MLRGCAQHPPAGHSRASCPAIASTGSSSSSSSSAAAAHCCHASALLSSRRATPLLQQVPCCQLPARAPRQADAGRGCSTSGRPGLVAVAAAPPPAHARPQPAAPPTAGPAPSNGSAAKLELQAAARRQSELPLVGGADSEQAASAGRQSDELVEQPPEAGVLPAEALRLDVFRRGDPSTSTSSSPPAASSSKRAANPFAYPPAERNQIRDSWDALMRWSKVFAKAKREGDALLDGTEKVVIFGGGSFGTAMGCALARQRPTLDVVLLVRDPYLCRDINTLHENTRYLKGFVMPNNVRATTHAPEAIVGAKFAVHAVPVQSSRAFLQGIKDVLPSSVPIICVSKGLEVGSGQTMSELIPSALERKQPAVFLSGPSFAKEVMQGRPTGVVAACRDAKLAKVVQSVFASPTMRVNTTTDVVGVEICGALKNVLAIAAGIVEGMDLGHNALAALVAQGCSEIRWLAEKLGGKPTTMSGLSGLGDIMLTCYGDLSRNRTVGIRLGRGEKLEDILASSPQVAEGVATAGVVVGLARKYRVSLPVLTAVAQVLDNNLTAREAVDLVMALPQIEEA